MVKRKIITASLVIVIALCVGVLLISNMIKSDKRQREELDKKAIQIGILKSKEECIKEGKTRAICSSITGISTVSECNGVGCWMIYAPSKNHADFSATIEVELENGRIIVTRYHRNEEL